MTNRLTQIIEKFNGRLFKDNSFKKIEKALPRIHGQEEDEHFPQLVMLLVARGSNAVEKGGRSVGNKSSQPPLVALRESYGSPRIHAGLLSRKKSEADAGGSNHRRLEISNQE